VKKEIKENIERKVSGYEKIISHFSEYKDDKDIQAALKDIREIIEDLQYLQKIN
jgi:hypothetical protein